jgi:hypothetical protein
MGAGDGTCDQDNLLVGVCHDVYSLVRLLVVDGVGFNAAACSYVHIYTSNTTSMQKSYDVASASLNWVLGNKSSSSLVLVSCHPRHDAERSGFNAAKSDKKLRSPQCSG